MIGLILKELLQFLASGVYIYIPPVIQANTNLGVAMEGFCDAIKVQTQLSLN